MIADTPQSVIDKGIDRFLADGVHYRDLINIRNEIRDWDDWRKIWSAYAAEAESRGEAALMKDAGVTAADEFFRASLYYHYAQFLYFDDVNVKEKIHKAKTDAFARAAPLLDPPAEIVTFPFRGIDITGYLRTPESLEKPPVVLLIGGLDTTKEDYRSVSDICLKRGMATLAFDGPGQGETVFKMRTIPDFEAAISAAIDYLETRPEVDTGRIGIVGRSMGGYFAPRAASVDRRIKVLVAWGAVYDLLPMDQHTPPNRTALTFITGKANAKEAEDYLSFLNLQGYADRITVPTLVIHGGLDRVTPFYNAEKLLADIKSEHIETMLLMDSGHCCHDKSHIVRPAIGDFLARYI
ncbi:S9 family peptidase [Burkholderia sp. Bp9142]|uniref:alpha/beta hydrolase family protein n=1 Tax=Burkholderia sp. Bp9142 TaxID=2184573 RepID=UPI000F5AA92F|nr:alpha/beta fold hydrolase [Burkholderia sp. Bp9142]RQR24600.1 alpha/beta fold hydrolase [Burkholderia sp. Bp9142]